MFGTAVCWPSPPGKKAEPVSAVAASAPARLKVLWPEVKPGKAGVTKVRSW